MIWEFRKMKSSLGTIYAASRLISRGVYNVSGPFHPFGGAVDMIVVQQPCGSFKSSPWYVRFGKFQGILKARKKVVSINVNGVEADFHMFLDNKGEAYFLNDVVGEEKKEEEGSLSSSRPSSLSEESKSCNLDGTQKNSSAQNDKGEGKIVARKKSRRFSGLLFWRKLMKKGIGSEMYVSPRTIVASGGSWRPWFLKRLKTMGAVHPVFDGIRGSNADNASEKRSYLWPYKNVHKIKVNRKKEMSIVPSSEHLASLNLKEGRNIIKFTFSTAMLGKQQVDARVYLMKWNTRIVVTDVDGTITKSDVLGQFMPLIGKDWSQTGVAHLFSAIETGVAQLFSATGGCFIFLCSFHLYEAISSYNSMNHSEKFHAVVRVCQENGYKFLYLSARPVSQAYLTRQFLINLKQDGKALPDGPVVISADGLLFSLYREVVRRAPHEFKIPCLEDIKALFPPDCNPFYAGFGNRATDELSYLKVGIPKGKIFTINPKGEVACLLSPLHGEVAADRMIDMKSYTSLHADVNATFPATFSDGQQLICGGFNGEERHHILASLQITFGLGAVSRNAEGKISGSCCSLCFSR